MATMHNLPARAPAHLRVPGRVQPRARRCIQTCCWLSEVGSAVAQHLSLRASDTTTGAPFQGGSVPTQWSQNLKHVYIKVTLPDAVKGRNIEVDIKRSYVSVQFNGTSIVQGSLDDEHGIEPAGYPDSLHTHHVCTSCCYIHRAE
jgi:hypothetical protein